MTEDEKRVISAFSNLPEKAQETFLEYLLLIAEDLSKAPDVTQEQTGKSAK